MPNFGLANVKLSEKVRRITMNKYLVKVVDTGNYGYGPPENNWIPESLYSQVHDSLEQAARDFVRQEELDEGYVTIEEMDELQNINMEQYEHSISNPIPLEDDYESGKRIVLEGYRA